MHFRQYFLKTDISSLHLSVFHLLCGLQAVAILRINGILEGSGFYCACKQGKNITTQADHRMKKEVQNWFWGH